MTDLDHINEDNQVIIFQIHRMLRADNIGNGLDNNIAIELVVASYSRPNSVLER
jgi:hypothetical protein